MFKMQYMWIVAGVLILIVILIIFKRTGIIKSKIQKQTTKLTQQAEQKIAVAVTEMSDNDYFKPSAWASAPSGKLLSNSLAKQKAQTIHNAWGFFNDNEEQVFGVFRTLTSKYQISQIADQYLILYNVDLMTDLIGRMSKTEIATINTIISKI